MAEGIGGLPSGFGMRTLMLAARAEAQQAGARDVRAEHLLLALAASGTPAAQLLADAGLNREALLAALAAERERSLAAVGMRPMAADRLRASGTVAGNPGWGASAKEALMGARRRSHIDHRAAQLARRLEQRARRLDEVARRYDEAARHVDRGGRHPADGASHHRGPANGRHDHGRAGQLSELDVLYAVLSADLGTVPRALKLAGVDRRELLAAVDHTTEE